MARMDKLVKRPRIIFIADREDDRAFRAAAQAAGLTLSDWIRTALRAEVRRGAKKKGEKA